MHDRQVVISDLLMVVVVVVVQVSPNRFGHLRSSQRRRVAASHGCTIVNPSSSPPKMHSTAGLTHPHRHGTLN